MRTSKKLQRAVDAIVKLNNDNKGLIELMDHIGIFGIAQMRVSKDPQDEKIYNQAIKYCHNLCSLQTIKNSIEREERNKE